MKTPVVQKRGESLQFLWGQVGISLDLLHEKSDGIHGEITIQHEYAPDTYGHIHWARINLSSTSARDSLRRVLNGKTKDDLGSVPYEWEPMIEYACSIAAQRHREGEPFVHLRDLDVPPKLSFLVDKILPAGQTSLIYSRGGSGKSLMALALAIAARTGQALPGGLIPNRRTGVIYLDYETDEDEQRIRLEWLCNGFGLMETPDIICRHQTRPLADDMARIHREIDRENVGLVIVDSIAYALGGSALDAIYVIEAFNSLRSLGKGVTRLVIAHIPKVEKEQKSASIYGSVFFENAGRSVWEMRATDETDGVTMALFQRKANWGKKFPPIGLRFVFDDDRDALSIRSHSVEDDPELVSHGSASYQLIAALRQGKKTIKQLVSDTDGNMDTVRRTMLRLEKRGEVIAFGSNTGGPNNEKLYGLAHLNGRASQ